MGYSKAVVGPTRAIVVLQWESGPRAKSPYLQFWYLDLSDDDPAQSLPIPIAVQGRIDASRPSPPGITGWASEGHLPPLLIYDSLSSSIMVHDLAVSETGIDLEVTRWSPGIRLTQFQSMANSFDGKTAGLSDAQHVSPAALIFCSSQRDYDDEYDNRCGSSGPRFLTAVAVGNAKGTASIKFRAKQAGRNPWLPLSMNEAYKYHERTVRNGYQQGISVAGSSGLASWPTPTTTIPVHACYLGRSQRYLVLVTLGRDLEDKITNTLSLQILDEPTVLAEAASTKPLNEDQGLRWQTQSFTLPAGVFQIAPIAMEVKLIKYLVVFYFYKGLLHFARLEYTGSGFFKHFIDKTPCVPVVPKESRTTAHSSAGSKSRWRWFISPHAISNSHIESEQKTSFERITPKQSADSLPRAAEGCQLYVTLLHGFIWVFYEGTDMNGKYVRRKVPREMEDLGEDWEAASWTTEPGLKDSSEGSDVPVSRHFIPVAVPENFMHMT